LHSLGAAACQADFYPNAPGGPPGKRASNEERVKNGICGGRLPP